MPATSPYLLLSFSIPADATDTKRAVTDALALHDSAWMTKYSTAVVRVPTLTEVQAVIDSMIGIGVGYSPEFSFNAVLVPYKQAHWALKPLENPAGVKRITGRDPE